MSAAPDDRPFRVFASLWAIALLFETARAFLGSGLLTIVLSVFLGRFAALWVLARPAAVERFLMLNAAVMLTIFLKLPKANNHGVFIFLVGATIFAAWLRQKLADRSEPVQAASFYTVFAPVLRWELLAMYFWAVVHKLNVDFFAVDVSCGPAQLFNVHARFPLFPTWDWLNYFSIHGTLAVEAGIPLLLVFRRTRWLGMLLAAAFHYMLGVGYAGFSAMLFAMLTLFAPPSFYDALWGAARRPLAALRRAALSALRVGTGVDAGLSALVAGFAGLSLLALSFFPEAQIVRAGPPLLEKSTVVVLWLVWGAISGGLLGWCAWRSGIFGIEPAPLFRPRYWSLAVMPLLVFLNGTAPHLGLKNTQAFAMFSNLETGGGRSNHLFIPSTWQRFGHLSDLVSIHSSNDVVLDKLVGPSWKTFNFYSTYVVDRPKMERLHEPPGWRLPYFALKRRIHYLARTGHTGVEVAYERGGEVRRVSNAELDPELSRVPYLLNKFLLMRAVPESDRGYCLW